MLLELHCVGLFGPCAQRGKAKAVATRLGIVADTGVQPEMLYPGCKGGVFTGGEAEEENAARRRQATRWLALSLRQIPAGNDLGTLHQGSVQNRCHTRKGPVREIGQIA